jgi:hypothetical protein
VCVIVFLGEMSRECSTNWGEGECMFAAQIKEFFMDGLKKLEQRSHKCVELKGEYVYTFFFSLVAYFLYKAIDLSATPTSSCS